MFDNLLLNTKKDIEEHKRDNKFNYSNSGKNRENSNLNKRSSNE